MYLDESGDRRERIAAEVQGKNDADVVHHYQVLEEDVDSIDGDRVPLPSIQRMRWVMVLPLVGRLRWPSRKSIGELILVLNFL